MQVASWSSRRRDAGLHDGSAFLCLEKVEHSMRSTGPVCQWHRCHRHLRHIASQARLDQALRGTIHQLCTLSVFTGVQGHLVEEMTVGLMPIGALCMRSPVGGSVKVSRFEFRSNDSNKLEWTWVYRRWCTLFDWSTDTCPDFAHACQSRATQHVQALLAVRFACHGYDMVSQHLSKLVPVPQPRPSRPYEKFENRGLGHPISHDRRVNCFHLEHTRPVHVIPDHTMTNEMAAPLQGCFVCMTITTLLVVDELASFRWILTIVCIQ
ncbi:hypothetical protein V8B97DRAFT_43512 [Scleroderma yunnanense]